MLDLFQEPPPTHKGASGGPPFRDAVGHQVAPRSQDLQLVHRRSPRVAIDTTGGCGDKRPKEHLIFYLILGHLGRFPNPHPSASRFWCGRDSTSASCMQSIAPEPLSVASPTPPKKAEQTGEKQKRENFTLPFFFS